jgi:hypothetical protein
MVIVRVDREGDEKRDGLESLRADMRTRRSSHAHAGTLAAGRARNEPGAVGAAARRGCHRVSRDAREWVDGGKRDALDADRARRIGPKREWREAAEGGRDKRTKPSVTARRPGHPKGRTAGRRSVTSGRREWTPPNQAWLTRHRAGSRRTTRARPRYLGTAREWMKASQDELFAAKRVS